MHTDPSARPQGRPEPNVKGYEKSDVRVKWVWAFLALLALGAIVIHFILGWQLSALEKGPPPADPWTGPRRAARAPVIPPRDYPRLQLSPPADMVEFAAREEAILNTYGWVNKTGGIVRIPIDRAMDLVVQKNLLPVRQGTNQSKPGPSNLQLQQQRPLQREPEIQGGR